MTSKTVKRFLAVTACAVVASGVLCAGLVEYQARLVRTELAAARAFLSTSLQRAGKLEQADITEFSCERAPSSKRQAKAAVGATDFVAQVIAASGELPLSYQASRVVVGSNGCAFQPNELKHLQSWGTFAKRARDFVQAPSWPRQLPLPDCMNTLLTDLGVVAVSHLTQRGEKYVGRLDLEVFDFETQERLCSGSLSAELALPDAADGRARDQALTRGYAQLIEQALAVPPKS
jgi:hypothetical protein